MTTNYSSINTNVESTTLVNMIDILEQERKRISFDLHDNVQHKLRLLRDEAPAQIKLQIDEVLNELRTICYNLVPKSLEDFKLREYLPVYVVTLQRSYAFYITYKSNVTTELPKRFEIELFGIVNEAITNIIKYSQTPVVIMRFWEDTEKFSLSIQDIGVGFDTSVPTNTLGLASIQNRSKLIGATYHIESEPGDGCKIKIVLPKANVAPINHNEPSVLIPNNIAPLPHTNTTATKETISQDDSTLNILILDNQEEVIRGLESIIGEKFEQAQIVTFTKPSKALEYLHDYSVDIVISDITMPDETGFQFIKKAKLKAPDSKYIVYSINNLPIYVARAVKELNVNAFVWKEDEWEDEMHPIVKAIHEVKGGACFYSKEISDIEKGIDKNNKKSSWEDDGISKYVFILVVKILSDKSELDAIIEKIACHNSKLPNDPTETKTTFKKQLAERFQIIMTKTEPESPAKYKKLKDKILEIQEKASETTKRKGDFGIEGFNFYMKILNKIHEDIFIKDDYQAKWFLYKKIGQEVFEEDI